jgi:hypothetical protein
MIYLAAPYSHPDPDVVQARIETIYYTIAQYVSLGKHITTPMFMHEVVTRYKLPSDYEFWEQYCLGMLVTCDKMVVLKLEGWDTSRGVIAEVAFCERHNIPIVYIDVVL